MTELSYGFEYFSTRNGFNDAATHFDKMMALLGDFSDRVNLADRLNQMLNEKEIRQEQVPSIVSVLLADKFGYHHTSINMPANFMPPKGFAGELSSWKGADFVVAYNHPDLGYTVINPKNPRHWESIHLLKQYELLTVYVGGFDKPLSDPGLAAKGASSFLNLIQGKRGRVPDALKKGNYNFVDLEKPKKPRRVAPSKGYRRTGATRRTEVKKAPQQEEESPKADPVLTANVRMTPRYSIPVTNELFHNGNVEAWKKIIQSYQVTNPGLTVCIYYDGERIHDIHTLFKWGKVKHGSTILFAVTGEEIKDVAKLQRYLRQGASPRFEDFLRFPVNKILNLF